MSNIEVPVRAQTDASDPTPTEAEVDVRSIASKARRGGSVAIASQAVRFVMQLVAAVVMGRLLTPDDYGVTAMVFAVSAFLSMFRYLGLSQATVQRSKVDQATLSTLFWINAAASGILSVLLAVSAPALAHFYHEPRLAPITVAVALTFFITGLGIQHSALMQRNMQFSALATVDVTAVLISIGTSVILAWLGFGYWSLVLGQFLLQAATTVGVWIASRWKPGLPGWTAEARSMLTFGSHVTGFTFVNYFVRNLDNVLIGRYWGSVPLGYYAKAYQMLLMPLTQINVPLTPVALSTLSRLRHDAEAYRRAYLRMISLIASISMPLVGALAGCADWVVIILLGPKWVESAHLYAILSLAAIVQPITNTTGWVLLSQGRARETFRLAVILAPITLGGFVAGLPWGPAGVAWCYAITEMVIRTPAQFWVVGREGPIRARDIWAILVSWFITSFAIFVIVSAIRRTIGLHWSPYVGVIVCGLVTCAITLAVPRLTKHGRETHRAWLELLRPFLTRLKLRRVTV